MSTVHLLPVSRPWSPSAPAAARPTSTSPSASPNATTASKRLWACHEICKKRPPNVKLFLKVARNFAGDFGRHMRRRGRNLRRRRVHGRYHVGNDVRSGRSNRRRHRGVDRVRGCHLPLWRTRYAAVSQFHADDPDPWKRTRVHLYYLYLPYVCTLDPDKYSLLARESAV